MLAPVLAERVGTGRAIALGLVLIGAGTAARALPAVAPLYLGTLVLGVGVAVGNVLLPAVAKRSFPRHAGPITSLYSSAMGIGAALAAGLSVPVAQVVGWRAALGAWAIPSVIALVVWAPQLRSSVARPGTSAAPPSRLFREPLAWQVAAYLGLQSASFYVLLAWLPDLLQARGLSESAAGGQLALSQITGIVGSALVPLWAGRIDDHRAIVALLVVLEAMGLVGLLTTGGEWAWLWVGLLGAVLGGTFALALTLIVVRAEDSRTAGKLSGMAQSVGYALAAGTPPLFGALYDGVGSWAVLSIGLMVVLAAKAWAGALAGRPRQIG